MTDPTPEAYEAAARADHDVNSLCFGPIEHCPHRAEHVNGASAAVDAALPIIEAQIRAKVAAEIRQHAQDEIRLQSSWLWHALGESRLETAAEKFADRVLAPPAVCANCDMPIAKARTSTGWTHVGEWSGVRCKGAITGARIAEGSTDG